LIDSSCHCGAVRLEIEVEAAPTEVSSCNCSICRRNGTLWAYYSPKLVKLNGGATDIYMWGDRMLELHRCKICGCVTHWVPVDKTYDRMGVNARLMAPDVLAAAKVKLVDGASM